MDSEEKTEKVGSRPITPITEVVQPVQDPIEITFSFKNSIDLLTNIQKSGQQQCLLKRFAVVEMDHHNMLQIKLPQTKYSLNVPAGQDDKEYDPLQVCNSLIQCTHEQMGLLPFPTVQDGIIGKDKQSMKLVIK